MNVNNPENCVVSGVGAKNSLLKDWIILIIESLFITYRWKGQIVWGVCSEDVTISSIPKPVLSEQKKVGISKYSSNIAYLCFIFTMYNRIIFVMVGHSYRLTYRWWWIKSLELALGNLLVWFGLFFSNFFFLNIAFGT